MARSKGGVRWATQRPGLVVLALIALLLWIASRSGDRPAPWQELQGIPDEELAKFTSRAVNNTVVMVPVNTGMLHWAENLLCSLRRTSFNSSSVVFWALDEGAQTALSRRGHAAYRDPALFATSGNENFRGDTAAYRRMMKERPKFFINVLASGFDLLMLDADTVWWQSPLLVAPPEHDKGLVDAVFSTDAREFYHVRDAFRDERRRGELVPPICNGIFWMKSGLHTVALWKDMLDVFHAPGWRGWFRRRRFQDDQRGMDVLLNDGRAALVGPLPDGITDEMLPNAGRPKPDLSIRLLDQTLVVNGHLLRNRQKTYEENRVKLRARGQERIAAHFNWRTTDATKEEGAKAMDMYFLDEQGRCRFT